MTNRAVKGLVVAAIIGGSLFATDGAAFADGTQPSGAVVTGTGQGDSEKGAILSAMLNADSQCQSGITVGHIDYSAWPTNVSETQWAAWWRQPCK
jgi:hypothetical protein